MDLASIELVEDLHEDKRVEDDGVVLRRRSVEGGVPPAVDVEHLLTCKMEGQAILNSCLYNICRFFCDLVGFFREFDSRGWWLHKTGLSVLQKNAMTFAVGGPLSEKPVNFLLKVKMKHVYVHMT